MGLCHMDHLGILPFLYSRIFSKSRNAEASALPHIRGLEFSRCCLSLTGCLALYTSGMQSASDAQSVEVESTHLNCAWPYTGRTSLCS